MSWNILDNVLEGSVNNFSCGGAFKLQLIVFFNFRYNSYVRTTVNALDDANDPTDSDGNFF